MRLSGFGQDLPVSQLYSNIMQIPMGLNQSFAAGAVNNTPASPASSLQAPSIMPNQGMAAFDTSDLTQKLQEIVGYVQLLMNQIGGGNTASASTLASSSGVAGTSGLTGMTGLTGMAGATTGTLSGLSGLTGSATGLTGTNTLNGSTTNPFLAQSTGLTGVSGTLASTASASGSGKQVIVLDDLAEGHGQKVQQVVNGTLSSKNVSGVNVKAVQQNVPKPAYQSLDQAVNVLLTGALSERAKEIQTMSAGGKTGVINLSNGMSPIDIVMQLGNLAAQKPAVMSDIKKSLNLPANSTQKDLYQGLLTYVKGKMANSSEFSTAKQQYNAAVSTANTQNTALVVASGNSQDDIAKLRAMGVSVSDEDGLNLLAADADNVITVGAIDDKGTASASDDQATAFGSRGKVTVAANGVKVLGNALLEGTSFSAPQVTALIAAIQQKNPNMSIAEIKSLITSSASDNQQISSAIEGAGNMQWDATLAKLKTA